MTDDISTLMIKNKDKVILLRLKNDKTVRGTLVDFDIHMNMVLGDAQDVSTEKHEELGKILLRGDNILAISPPDDPDSDTD